MNSLASSPDTDRLAAGPATRTSTRPSTPPARIRHEPVPISLALQGGGALGAYTWGVLDALLARADLPIDQVSGTSAGALNGAVLASALATGGRREARLALESFWRSVAEHPTRTMMHALMGPVGELMSRGMQQWLSAGAQLSPWQADPLDVNPLRAAIAAHVDVQAIRSRRGPQLFVTATRISTGLPRVFGSAEMSVDALMASACLPQLFRPVMIDGEAYWDGGYGGNPSLWPLVRHGRARDLLLVQLVPDRAVRVPRSAAAIRERAAEIVFNASLVAEMQAIHAVREWSSADTRLDVVGDGASARVPSTPLSRTRFHRIGPPTGAVVDRSGGSVDRSWDWMTTLRDAGRSATRRFLARERSCLGRSSTLDIGRVFVDGRKPRVNLPVAG